MDYVSQLREIPENNDFFIGIDSDGCVFDTMEIKHKECFCPAFIHHFELQAASKYAREIWEFVNLYSKTRGCNRFLAVKHALDLIRNRDVFAHRGIFPGEYPDMHNWLNTETKLGIPMLEERIQKTGSEELAALLEWSKDVNKRIADMVYGIPPFPAVKKVLEKSETHADMIVVSQTPLEALTREWKENKLAHYLSLIAGQEHGTKTEHLKYAIEDKHYGKGNVLMVGDAPGDLKAAQANNVLFYPVIPGDEEASWEQFADEGIDRFFNGTFAGEYQKLLLEDFEKALPENPPWE